MQASQAISGVLALDAVDFELQKGSALSWENGLANQHHQDPVWRSPGRGQIWLHGSRFISSIKARSRTWDKCDLPRFQLSAHFDRWKIFSGREPMALPTY